MCIVQKIIIDLFMIIVLLVLKLFVSSHHLNFEGILAFMFFLFHEGQAGYHFIMFSLWFKQTYHFQCIIAHCQLFVLLFMCNIIAKFMLVQIIFIMLLLKCFDLSLQCFYIMVDRVFVVCMSPQKLFFYHLPTRGRAGVKLGDTDTSQTYL